MAAVESQVHQLRPAEPPRRRAGDEPLRRTVNLICDLADALNAQASRVRREAAVDAEGASTVRLVDALADQASRVRRQAAQLAETFDTIDTPADRPPAEPGAPTPLSPMARPGREPGGRSAPDPAQVLTQEMKLAGTSRQEAHAYLTDSFELSNAEELIERVYGPEPDPESEPAGDSN